MVEYVSREILDDLEVGSDPDLSKEEKETTITVDNDREKFRIHTDIPTHIRWIRSIPDGRIVAFRTVNDTLVGVKADVPKGYLKLQSTNRKSQQNAAMVTYGDQL